MAATTRKRDADTAMIQYSFIPSDDRKIKQLLDVMKAKDRAEHAKLGPNYPNRNADATSTSLTTSSRHWPTHPPRRHRCLSMPSSKSSAIWKQRSFCYEGEEYISGLNSR